MAQMAQMVGGGGEIASKLGEGMTALQEAGIA
jgi:hypothetical protein